MYIIEATVSNATFLLTADDYDDDNISKGCKKNCITLINRHFSSLNYRNFSLSLSISEIKIRKIYMENALSVTVLPPNLTHWRDLVTPAKFLLAASLFPSSLFISADLPTLGKPMMAALTARGWIPLFSLLARED